MINAPPSAESKDATDEAAADAGEQPSQPNRSRSTSQSTNKSVLCATTTSMIPQNSQTAARDSSASNDSQGPRTGRESLKHVGITLKDIMDKQRIGMMDVVAILMGAIIPNILLIFICSTVGIGDDFYNSVAPAMVSIGGDIFLCCFCFLAVLLYVLGWDTFPKPLKVLTAVFVLILFVVGVISKGRRYGWGPMLLIMFLMPLSIGCYRAYIAHQVKRRDFYLTTAGASGLVATLVLLVWLHYMFIAGDNSYNRETKNQLIADFSEVYDHVYSERALVYEKDCGPAKDVSSYDTATRQAIDAACDEAATVWWFSYMCPMIGIMCDLVLCVFCLVTGTLANNQSTSEMNRALIRFFISIGFLLAGLYATSALAATSIRMANALVAFCMAGIIMLLAWIYIEIDIRTIAAVAKESPMAKQLVQVWNWDVTKAAILGAMMMPLTMFFAANMLKQTVNRWKGSQSQNRFTTFGQNIAEGIRKWRWTPVLIWLCLLSELFFTFQVGVTKATYVFLSWLNSALANVSLGVVLILMFVIGNLMFLLPPVPGLPVYVFGGILIGEKGYQDPNIGIWGGCGIAIVLCLFTKLCACTMQYMIGYFAGKSVKVQQLIGVDKVGTRALEQILKTRGLNLKKVSVLVGGPDWPTSVTCGIIRVNIPQMLLGTIPVLALMAPCVFAGACLGRVTIGEDSMWGTWAQAFTAVAALVNAAAGAYAVYAVSETVKTNGEELAKPREEHAKVEALTAEEKAFNDKYAEVTAWPVLTTNWKVALCVATSFLYWSNFFFVMLKEYCFRPFAVSSDIDAGYDEDGLEGDVLSIILPAGWFFLALFAVGVLMHLYVQKSFTGLAQVAFDEDLTARTVSLE